MTSLLALRAPYHMRFALLGDHIDGLDLACALNATGRHDVYLYTGSPTGLAHLQRHGLHPRVIGDLEEVLADPELDAVIVAGSVSARPGQLRRALQSELHVACVHPADPSPDIAYEAAMIQADTGRVLLPMLPMTLHPGVVRLAELARRSAPRVIELEVWATDAVVLDGLHEAHKPGLPGWDVLRYLGGEIGEIYLQSTQAEMLADAPLLLSGRFVRGAGGEGTSLPSPYGRGAGGEGLLQAIFLPDQADASWRLSLVTTTGRATLVFGAGWPGPAQLTYVDEHGERRAEEWGPFHPWPAWIERFEQAVMEAALRKPMPGQPALASLTQDPPVLGWQDELRALELDEAARRSVERGRSNTLDLQETTEEASFKGTMTLVGCSLIWLTVVVLILSIWIPWLAWLIVPVIGVFLLMQALRWVVPAAEPTKDAVPRDAMSVKKLQ